MKNAIELPTLTNKQFYVDQSYLLALKLDIFYDNTPLPLGSTDSRVITIYKRINFLGNLLFENTWKIDFKDPIALGHEIVMKVNGTTLYFDGSIPMNVDTKKLIRFNYYLIKVRKIMYDTDTSITLKTHLFDTLFQDNIALNESDRHFIGKLANDDTKYTLMYNSKLFFIAQEIAYFVNTY